jgi:hypothetical protein
MTAQNYTVFQAMSFIVRRAWKSPAATPHEDAFDQEAERGREAE